MIGNFARTDSTLACYLLGDKSDQICLFLLAPLNILQSEPPNIIKSGIFKPDTSAEIDLLVKAHHGVISSGFGAIEKKEFPKKTLLNVQVVKVVQVLSLFRLRVQD